MDVHHLPTMHLRLPDELVPLWKILYLAGADWTYGSAGWAGENDCMFLAGNDSWEKVTRDDPFFGRPGSA